MIAGELQPALQWLDLGELRGSAELGSVASALRSFGNSLGKGESEEEPELDPRIRRAWSAELDASRAALVRGARGP
jgi:hypothetical protein